MPSPASAPGVGGSAPGSLLPGGLYPHVSPPLGSLLPGGSLPPGGLSPPGLPSPLVSPPGGLSSQGSLPPGLRCSLVSPALGLSFPGTRLCPASLRAQHDPEGPERELWVPALCRGGRWLHIPGAAPTLGAESSGGSAPGAQL